MSNAESRKVDFKPNLENVHETLPFLTLGSRQIQRYLSQIAGIKKKEKKMYYVTNLHNSALNLLICTVFCTKLNKKGGLSNLGNSNVCPLYCIS